MGHGVACIDGQIHQYLLEVARIGPNIVSVRGSHELQVNVLSNQPLENFASVFDH